MNQRGFIALPVMAWAAIAAGVVILGLGVAVKVQSARLDSEKAAFSAFRAQVEALGLAAQKEAARVNLVNLKAMEAANVEYAKVKGDLASSYAAYRKLRNANSGQGGMPIAPTVTSGSDRTCFATDQFAHAMGVLEAGVPNITEQGDAAKSRLIGAMKWATSVGAR